MKTFLAFMFCVFSLVMLAITSTGAVASIESAVSSTATVTQASIVAPVKADVGSIAAFDTAGDTGIPGWLQILSLVVTAAAAVAAATPSPKDDGVLLIVRKIIDLCALNFWGAKNAKPTKNPTDYL